LKGVGLALLPRRIRGEIRNPPRSFARFPQAQARCVDKNFAEVRAVNTPCAERYCRRVSSDPDDRLDALLSDQEPEVPHDRARRAAAGVASAFGLVGIWLVVLAVVIGAMGFVVLHFVLPLLFAGAL
jgi:hypothetical protein